MLRKATNQGLLSPDEFDTRADRARHARTRAELNGVLIDLPGLVNRGIGAGLDATPGQQHAQPLAGDPPPPGNDRAELTASLSSVVRSGRWSVPRELMVYSRLGRVVLDLTQAEIRHPVVSVELDVAVGRVQLCVPVGATVDVDGLDLVMGGVRHRGEHPAAATGVPHVVLIGSVRLGSVVIRWPRSRRSRAPLLGNRDRRGDQPR